MNYTPLIWFLCAIATHLATKRCVVSLKRRQKASGRMVSIKCDFTDHLWISYFSFMFASLAILLYTIYFNS